MYILSMSMFIYVSFIHYFNRPFKKCLGSSPLLSCLSCDPHFHKFAMPTIGVIAALIAATLILSSYEGNVFSVCYLSFILYFKPILLFTSYFFVSLVAVFVFSHLYKPV